MKNTVEPLPGFAGELDCEWDPSQMPLDSSQPFSEREKIVKYLREGYSILSWMEATFDKIGGEFSVAGGSAICSDGIYYWRQDAADYIEHYGAALPEHVLGHFRHLNWEMPKLSDERLKELDKELYMRAA